MPIRLTDDPDRQGRALLHLDERLASPPNVSLQFLDRSFLGPDGRRTRERHLFATELGSDHSTVALGPVVTAHVAESELVAIADANGRLLGRVAWVGIRAPVGARPGIRVGADQMIAPPKRPPPTGVADVAAVAPLDPHAAEPAQSAVPLPSRRPEPRRRPAAWVFAIIVPALLAVYAGLVLSGRVGWELSPATLAFAGRQGGTIEPAAGEAVLRARWYAAPFARLWPPVIRQETPANWLVLSTFAEGDSLRLRAAPTAAAAGIGPGDHRVRVLATFALGGASAGHAVRVDLHLDEPPPPPAAAPPVKSPEPSPVDDAACDRAGGSHFDPDHPADAAFVEEVFDLSPTVLDAGIAACDPRSDRTGADRRLLVQRGRLLAGRALAKAAAGDLTGARRDMDDALAAWRTGQERGSAFADSLMGSYLFGSFNRPSLTFTRPDDAAATAAWKRGMDRGSVVAQRNFAAQLLAGRGAPADAARALTLLRDAAARGDDRAAGTLGVALYTGSPPGVTLEKTEGWGLLVRAQCVDRSSGDLVAAEVAAGRRPAADRRSCR